MTAPPKTVISNSSPLIALATIGRFDLLKSLFGDMGQELSARYVLLDHDLARRKADLIGLPVSGT